MDLSVTDDDTECLDLNGRRWGRGEQLVTGMFTDMFTNLRAHEPATVRDYHVTTVCQPALECCRLLQKEENVWKSIVIQETSH